MHYRDKLIQVAEYVNAEEETLIGNSNEKQKNINSDYGDWNFKDTIAHISEWRLIASKKLEAIRRNDYVSFHEDLDSINRTNYKKHINDTIEYIKSFSKMSYETLIKRIEVFDNSELQKQGQLVGFNVPLWRYIIVDSFLHPIAHIVFYYLKIHDFIKAFKILERSYILISELDDSKEILQDCFCLEDLFESVISCSILKDRLKDFYIRNLNDQLVSSEILNHFMVVNSIDVQ
jgi:hypothetical protein